MAKRLCILLPGCLLRCWAQPGTPINFQCHAASDTQINLIWDRADDADTSITMSRSTSSSGTYTPTTLTAHSNIFGDANGYPSTTYYYKVHASNGSGSSSDAGPVNCTTGPSAATFTAAGNFAVSNTDSWTNMLLWTDSNLGFKYWVVQRSVDGVWFSTTNPLTGASSSTGLVDPSLTPGTTYFYRVRVQDDGGGYSDWTSPLSVTTSARPSGYPLEITDFFCVVNSATQTVCTWTDTNSGTASTLIETSAFNNMAPSFSQVASVAAGTNTYTLTTTAETFYYIRARPSNGRGNGGYVRVVKIRTASGGAGSPQVYNIGSGQTYTTIGASPIAFGLGPGDTVNIYPGTYYEKFLISNRGTAANPININCMSGAIIDGTNAVSAAASEFGTNYTLTDITLVFVGRRNGQSSSTGWSPGYLKINGCEIRNAVNGQSYTLSNRSARTYSSPSCLYIVEGDHIAVNGTTIHNCSSGIFSAGTDDTRNVEVIQIGTCPFGNHIYGNGQGAGGVTLYHNAYQEGIGMIYECNRFGDLVTNSQGMVGVKDRSAGFIFRYNKVVDAAQQNSWLTIGEAQNYAQFTTVNPLWGASQIYGNDFQDLTGTGLTSSPSPFAGIGYPGNCVANGQLGPHLFYNNDLTLQSNRTQTYHTTLWNTQCKNGTVDVRNNIVWNGATSGNTASHIYLLGVSAVGHFGSNWVSSGYYACDEFHTCTGILGGSAAITNNGSTNDPGFTTSPTNDSFNLFLTVGGQAIGLGGVLGGNWSKVTEEYLDPNSGTPRSNMNDLGAYQCAKGGCRLPPALRRRPR